MANLATMKVVALILLACCPAVAAIQASSKVGRISCGQDQIEEKQEDIDKQEVDRRSAFLRNIREKLKQDQPQGSSLANVDKAEQQLQDIDKQEVDRRSAFLRNIREKLKQDQPQGSSLANVDKAEQQLQKPGTNKCDGSSTQQFLSSEGLWQELAEILGPQELLKLQAVSKKFYNELVPKAMTNSGQIPCIAPLDFPLVDDCDTLEDAKKKFPDFFNVAFCREKLGDAAKDAFFAVKVSGAILFGYEQQLTDFTVESNEEQVMTKFRKDFCKDKDSDTCCTESLNSLGGTFVKKALDAFKAAETAKETAETAAKAAATASFVAETAAKAAKTEAEFKALKAAHNALKVLLWEWVEDVKKNVGQNVGCINPKNPKNPIDSVSQEKKFWEAWGALQKNLDKHAKAFKAAVKHVKAVLKWTKNPAEDY